MNLEYADAQWEHTTRRLGYLAGWVSVVVNLVLFGFKYVAGTRIGSVAMVADAWHTLSDTFTSVIVIVGFWIAERPADRQHPFGHGRAEPIAAIVIATLLGVVGVGFFLESLGRLRACKGVEFDAWAIAIFLVSAGIKEALAQFAARVGRRAGSKSLAADAWHHRSDAIASALIVVGAVFGRAAWWLDGAMGIGVSLLILYAAAEVLFSSSGTLLGEPPDNRLRQGIEDIVVRHLGGAACLHHVHIHRYGKHTEVTMHLRLPADTRLRAAHTIVSTVEDAIRRELQAEITIHVEPDGPGNGSARGGMG